MSKRHYPLWCALALYGAVQASELPLLAQTSLFSKVVQGCREVDLKTWQHPTRKVLEKHKVVLRRLQLCNGNIYPVFYVSVPYDPQGQTKSYFLPLYDDMRVANGGHALAFVMESDNTVVMLAFKDKYHWSTDYEFYRLAPGEADVGRPQALR